MSLTTDALCQFIGSEQLYRHRLHRALIDSQHDIAAMILRPMIGLRRNAFQDVPEAVTASGRG